MESKTKHFLGLSAQKEKTLKKTTTFLKQQFGMAPEVAVVFGSGLGKGFLDKVKVLKSLSYKKVPGFGATAVEGHAGRLHWVSQKKPWIVLQGRKHYYEGLSAQEVVFPYQALAMWGVQKILITNASGSLRVGMKAGSLVWIKDHLNFTGTNPLMGPNLDFLGVRFPSLHDLYQNDWSKSVRSAARKVGVGLKGGVYVGLAGPSYETPAEVRAFQRLGGDLVGMSTVLDAIASHHAGMQVAALSAVTNACTDTAEEIEHETVLHQAAKADKKLGEILLALCQS